MSPRIGARRKRQRPTTDALWELSAHASGRRGRAYLDLLEQWGYFSWPLYNVEPLD